MSHKNKNIKLLILLFGIFSFFGILSKASAKIIWNNQMPPSNSFSRQSIPADIPNDNEKRRFIIVYHSQSTDVTEEIIEITDKAPIFEYDEVLTGVATEATVEAILEVEKMPEVAYIVEDFKLYTLDTRGNDLAGISAYQALSNDKGSGLAVAVIDDGVNYSHSAFFKTPANSKITSGALDNKGTYISDKIPFSYSYLDSGSKTQTQAGAHGSNVAGIIAADSSNAYQGGIPDAQLINLQALNPANGEGTLSGVIAAVNDAVSLNVDVINMSLGVGEQTGHIVVLENVVNAARSHGIIVACAAGNESSANFYPAPKLDLKAQWTVNSPSLAIGAISVAASGLDSEMADYSSWGGNTELDFKPEITAFGGGGKNASDYAYGPHTDNSSYNGMAGTSQATPLVSASAGLVKKALSAYYSGKELADKVDLALINTSQPLMEVAEQPYSPRKQGAGLIQVQRAIQNKVELTDIASSSDTQSDGILELKQITSRLITRQINLKNTSSTPMSYHWKDLGVYKNADSISANQALTDVAVNYSEVFIKDAKGYLTENTDTITVPANASIDLTVEINVSGDFSGNNFIEGFIRLVPIGSDEVEIGVPFMGFADNLPQTVTATFDANGGAIVDLATRKAEINTYLGNLPQANYSEKSFLGWYTSRNGGEKISERTKIAANTTYYARWDRLFTLNINKDDRPWQNHNKQFTLKQDTNIIATSTILEGNPVFTNVLDGNYDLYEGAKRLISQLTVTNDATQTLDYYTVSFDTNGAESNVPISQIVYKGKTCDIPSNLPVKKGYDFVKWVTVDGSTPFDFLNIVTAKTAYAKWQVITYPISYELDGGTNFSNPPSSYTVETSTITLANPTKQGFSFDGWYQEAEFTTKVTEIRRGSFGAITLFAKWRQNQTGNSEGSSGNEDQPTEEKPVEQMPSEEKPNQEIPSVSVEEPIIRFSDIASLNQESISAIQWLVDQQITTGYQSNNNNVRMFGPHDTLTRGQMVTFLYRFMGQPFISKTSTSFVDISNCSEEFKTAIAWAKEGGITTGYNKFYFGPNDSITREQITAFLYRLADSPKVTSKTTFTDISQESQFYNSITWLSSQGVIKGYNSQQFGPTDFTTREQMALIIKRFNDADIVKHS